MVKIRNKEVVADLARLTELCLRPAESISKSLIESAVMVNIGEGTGFFLNKEEASLFDKIVGALLAEHLSEYISEKFLRDSLWNYLREVFKNPDEFKKKSGESMQKFLDGLTTSPCYNWIVMFSLGNLTCPFSLESIGDVNFLTFVEANISEWKGFWA